MNHKTLKTLPVFVFLFVFSFLAKADIEFKAGGLDKIQKNAAAEGKLYFVNFTAAWCAPCQIMKEYTFTDPGVSYYARKNYLASQVDWDSFDGFDYRQQYNIRSLPATLIFNSKGKMVGKYEESLSATRMLEVLKKHDSPTNRIKTVTAPVVAPAPPSPAPKPIPKPTFPKGEPTAPQAPSGSGLFRFDVSPQVSSGFSVQIGVYAEYGNVLKEVAKFKNLFDEPILVHIDKLSNKTVYRVMIGEFLTSADANRFTQKVKQKGLNGFAKDLSGLK